MSVDKPALLIFGHGYSGEAISASCKEHFATIHGTTRSRDKAKQITAMGVEALIFDGTLSPAMEVAVANASHVLVSIAPGEDGDPVLNACRETLAASGRLQWLGYLSTVGVYGNHDGAWVDEESDCRPVSRRSRQRLEAENDWQDFAARGNLPLAIFRLSGIYGPGRNAFVNIEKGTARRLVKQGQVFNRIRREDIGVAVWKASQNKVGGIYNITDDEPAPPQDVVAFAHRLADKTPPPEIGFETAELSPMARSFYGENKRVSNAKSKAVLDLEYQYPNYRVSLTQLWESDQWK